VFLYTTNIGKPFVCTCFLTQIHEADPKSTLLIQLNILLLCCGSADESNERQGDSEDHAQKSGSARMSVGNDAHRVRVENSRWRDSCAKLCEITVRG
jgi:hypothetical protein